MRSFWKSQTPKKRIIFLCNSAAQLELAFLIASKSSYECTIFSTLVSDLERLERLKQPKNITYVFDFHSAKMIFGEYDVVLTFVGHISPALNPDIISILQLAVKTKTPIVELPHGLYQWGYGFSDNSQIIDGRSNEIGFGVNFSGIIDNKLDFFTDGYLGYLERNKNL